VHVEADEVAESVDEVVAVAGVVDDLARGLVEVLVVDAGLDQGQRRSLGSSTTS